MNEEKEILEENKIPGEENTETQESAVEESIDAETGTAESGDVSDEAATEDTTVEENVGSEDVENNEDVVSNEDEIVSNEEQPEKMLTQSQVNELVGKARAEGRASAMKELYERYGVNDDNEMNDVFGKGQGYDLLNDEYNNLNGRYGDVAAENALLKSGVIANRWDDVKAILGSKGMDITVENIQSEMTTHPEWQNSASMVSQESSIKELSPQMAEAFAENAKPEKMAQSQTSTIRKLGSNAPEPKVDTEESDAMNMFGLK